MNITSDLFAVQRRIDEIAGGVQPTARTVAPNFAMLRATAPRYAAAQAKGAPDTQARPTGARAFGSVLAVAYEALARRGALEAGVDPALVAAVTQTESGFDPRATSGTGAAGLMQLMPATADSLGVADPYDPVQNVRGGAAYLHQLLERFHGIVPLAVAAYNAGPGTVERYGGVPPFAETRAYVDRVMAAYRARGGL